MRIISKKRDYYDGYQNHDKKDRFNKLYLRKELEFFVKTADIKELEFNHVNLRNWDWHANFMVIGGKVIPFVIQRIRDGYAIDKYVSYFDADAAWEAYDKAVPDERGRWWWNKPSKKKFIQFFDAIYPSLVHVCIEREIPIFVVEPEENYFNSGVDIVRNVISNVNLLRYGFTKYKGAAEMYQEIDMFISNELVNDEMPASPQTNKEKVQSHGFDNEYGFRTRKKVK